MNYSKILIYFVLIIFTFILPLNVSAHPGGKDENDCHVCYTNCDKWGYEYETEHCHTDTVPKYTSPTADYSYKQEEDSNSDKLGFMSNNVEEDFLTKYSSQIESLLVILSYFIVAGFSYFLGSNIKKK